MAEMTARPTLKVLVVKGDWREHEPEQQVPMGASYGNLGYRVVALDPTTEAAWREWRADNPEAV